MAVNDREPTLFHCAYCDDDARLRPIVHCAACGHRVILAEPFSAGGRCDACIRWAAGERPIIDDDETVGSLFAAIAERAEKDTRPVFNTADFPVWCPDCEAVGERRLTRDCGTAFVRDLRAYVLAHEGDGLAALMLVATVASTRERLAA